MTRPCHALTWGLVAEGVGILEALLKNCGVGPDGFQPGNHCGAARRSRGKNRRQHRRRKRRSAEHADWLTHFKRERRTLGRRIRRERRQLQREHRGERRATNRSWRKEARSLKARHARESARTRNPKAMEARHAEERRDLAGQVREARSDQRLQQALEVREARAGHLSESANHHEDERVAHAEFLRGHLETTRDARYDRQEGGAKRYRTRPSTPTPDAAAILAAALEAAGHREAYEAGTLDDAGRREVLEAIALGGRAWMRHEAEAAIADVAEGKALFGAARDRLANFFDRARSHVRELFVAGLLAVSGPAPLSDAEQGTLDRNVAGQVEYLDRFEREAIAGDRPPGAAFAARAEQYGAAVWGHALEARRQAIIAARAGLSEALRVLGPNEHHCPECPPLADLGWVPIADVVPIGQTVCRVYCRCWIEYR
jgi:hypothetical protein